jgi:uronate dehydrogenase
VSPAVDAAANPAATVLLTGAAGRVGSALAAQLPDYGWSVRSFDRVPVAGGITGDITDPRDLDPAIAGVSAVVHMAGQPTEAPWPRIRTANIDGAYEVFEAARRAGVPRVVYASSNHAVGFTPVAPAASDIPAEIPADTPPRPDTLYGVSKVFGEALGRYYVDRYGMRVACLRIGTFAERPTHLRSLSTWLSPADCARLVDACLRSSSLTYEIVWGVSANTRRVWSLEAGRRIGYEPQDDAEDYLTTLESDAEHPSDAFVGGGFTSPGFGIDEVAQRS